MRKIGITICCLLLLTSLGCDHRPMRDQLATIDSLVIKERFDSAYNMANALDESQMTDEEDLAHYRLLKTQLGHIINQQQPSDSLLDLIITYYKKAGNSQKLADAYYYKSRSSAMKNNYPQAILYGKEAERLAMDTDDIYLQYKITETMAFLNSYCENYLLELQYGKKALALAQKAQNGNWKAYSYNILSVAFQNLGQFDSTLYYIEKSIPYINYIAESDKAAFLMNIGVLYKESDNTKAIEYLEKSLTYGERPLTYEHLADVYYAEGKHEEAYKLWKKALTTDGEYVKDNVLHTILSYNLEHGNLDEANNNIDRIIAIKDSIINVLRNDTIKDLQLRFDHEASINAANERLIRWQWYLGVAAFVLLMLIGLWLLKRQKMRTLLDKRQIEIHQLIFQVEEKKNEVLNYESQIAQLKTEQQKDSQTLAELESKIEELSRQKKEAQRDFLAISQKMKEWTGAETEKLRQGALLMGDIENNKSVRHWPIEKLEALIAYYCAVHTDLALRINKTSKKLTNKQILYLILVDMNKDLETMSRIMGIDKNSLRSYKFQINQKE